MQRCAFVLGPHSLEFAVLAWTIKQFVLFALSESVITISYTMAEIPRAFYGFLVLVDSPPKEQEFLLKVAKAFMLNDLSDHADLVGFDVADCTKGRSSLGLPSRLLCASLVAQVQYQVEALQPL